MTDDRVSSVSRRGALALGGAALAGATLGGPAVVGATEDADGDDDGDGRPEGRHYRVTVANLTRGQPLTPPVLGVHVPEVELFSVGDQASTEIQELAENGNLGPLVELATSAEGVRAAAVGDGPLVPSADPANTGNPSYTTRHLTAGPDAQYLSFVSMLVATNDGIAGLDTVPLPADVNASRTYYANGYDVGTERNTESFEDMVPPAQTLIQGGEADGGTAESDPNIAEDGVIRPHPGIAGGADLSPEVYGWREPAALVQVEHIAALQTRFSATLSGANEVPPVETEATGEATIAYDPERGELAFEVVVSNIEDVTEAHIHCGPVDANGPVGVTLYDGETVSPDGVLVEGTASGPDSENACGWETLDDVVAALRGDNTYVNVHTEANPPGEIRGQVH